MKEYGYIRVSTKEQNTDRQFIALKDAGLDPKNFFVDHESGKDFNRKNYKRLVKVLKEGDVVFIKAVDRLGRNYDDIIEQWAFITKKKKVDIVVLDVEILDTREKVNGLTGKLITDIFIQLMSYFAQMERDESKVRQAEGISAAKLKGVKFGRPKKEKPEHFDEVYWKWKKRVISGREAARRLNIDHNTFGKWAAEKENYKK